MKSLYIILTPTICNIAGAQLYVKSKVDYLKKNLYDVIVISTNNKGQVKIEGLQEYFEYINPLITIKPQFISPKIIKNQIELLTNNFNNGRYNKIILESHTKGLAFWGELLAERLHAKHLIFLLSENFGPSSKYELDFFNFKLERKEIAGIQKNSLQLLFRGYRILRQDESLILRASMGDNVLDYEHDLINKFNKADINIGSIGRLEKDYVPYMIAEVAKFASSNLTKTVQLILVGSINNISIQKIIDRYISEVSNLSIVVTGRLYPLPRKIFSIFDIGVGVAGSARVLALNGVPTVTIDTIKHKAIGVLGYETNSSIYGVQEELCDLSIKIQEVIDNYSYFTDPNNWKYQLKPSDPNVEFEKHFDFIKSSDGKYNYFPCLSIKLGFFEMFIRFIIFIIGPAKFISIMKISSIKNIYSKVMKLQYK